jgi:hypothetical protein
MTGIKFKPVGGRLVSKTTRRSMLNGIKNPQDAGFMTDEAKL